MARVASAVLVFPEMNSLRITGVAHVSTTFGFSWKWLALLAVAGIVLGLGLALIKSLPVS